jgi:glycosyltransferase involved in cell wall biosynthesis
MRIGIITGEYPPLQGGIGGYTDILSKRLASLGHELFIFSESRAVQQSPAIPLTHTKTWGLGVIPAIQTWVRVNRIELVSLQFQTAAFGMSPVIHFLPHFLDVPFVTTFHDLRFPYLFPKAGKLRDWIVMYLAKASTGIIVTNHEDYERVKHLKTALIPMGSTVLADESDFNKTQWRPSNEFLIAHFGFINQTKGVDTLLKALATLPNVHLLMIGDRIGTADPTNAAYAKTIDALITELGLENRISWTGFVGDDAVFNYLRAVDAVVLPFRDGASFRRSSLMVAIHLGCTIITTQPSVTIPEFEQGQLLLVKPEDSAELAAAIQKLKESPELRESLQTKVKSLRQRFDWNTIAQDIVKFYEGLR